MQFLIYAAAVLLSASKALAIIHHQGAEPTVRIRNGTLVGKYDQSSNQDVFLGVPFAQPPIGNLRFDVPQPLNETWEGPLNATVYGAHCINYVLSLSFDPADLATRYPQSEDCLTVKVVRPTGIENNTRLPVLVYIYGGAFQEGGSGDARYNMSALVENSVRIGQPSIAVTMNYRLQGWGFLAGSAVRNQGLLNLGLQDQRLALRWIQDNIEAFGGDPRRVTIQGESAGAASVGFHLLAYGGQDDGLFDAAICESGGPYYFGSFAPDSQSDETYRSVLKATNCTGSHDTLQCLRDAPFDILNTTFSSLMFIAGRRYTCEIWAQHGLPCYSYRFNTIPGHTDPLYRGATHYEEVAFVFDNLYSGGVETPRYYWLLTSPYSFVPKLQTPPIGESATHMQLYLLLGGPYKRYIYKYQFFSTKLYEDLRF